jgi:hypothetical protein
MAEPLYHGSRSHRIRPGDLIVPGRRPNPWGDTFDDRGRSVYVYATTSLSTAQAYADATGGRVYLVEPTGPVAPDYGPGDVKSTHPFRMIRKV